MTLFAHDDFIGLIKTLLVKTIWDFDLQSAGLTQEDGDRILSDFSADYARYFQNSQSISATAIVNTPPLIGIFLYRVARHLFLHGREAQALPVSNTGRYWSLSELYYSAAIGKGLKINHGVGLIVGARAVVGENCLLHQNITIGDRKGGRPTLGNGVTVYPGASILGNITIGDNSTIAAHALVLADVLPAAIIRGTHKK